MRSVLPVAVVFALLLAACASKPVYTQAQLNAIETRSVERDNAAIITNAAITVRD